MNSQPRDLWLNFLTTAPILIYLLMFGPFSRKSTTIGQKSGHVKAKPLKGFGVVFSYAQQAYLFWSLRGDDSPKIGSK